MAKHHTPVPPVGQHGRWLGFAAPKCVERSLGLGPDPCRFDSWVGATDHWRMMDRHFCCAASCKRLVSPMSRSRPPGIIIPITALPGSWPTLQRLRADFGCIRMRFGHVSGVARRATFHQTKAPKFGQCRRIAARSRITSPTIPKVSCLPNMCSSVFSSNPKRWRSIAVNWSLAGTDRPKARQAVSVDRPFGLSIHNRAAFRLGTQFDTRGRSPPRCRPLPPQPLSIVSVGIRGLDPPCQRGTESRRNWGDRL